MINNVILGCPRSQCALLKSCVTTSPQAEEALKSAIAEFEDQNVDLSNIIKSVSGGNTSGWAMAANVVRFLENVGNGWIPGSQGNPWL